jgi:hypothetical protein
LVGVSLCVTPHNFEEALKADEFLQLTECLRPRF